MPMRRSWVLLVSLLRVAETLSVLKRRVEMTAAAQDKDRIWAVKTKKAQRRLRLRCEKEADGDLRLHSDAP